LAFPAWRVGKPPEKTTCSAGAFFPRDGNKKEVMKLGGNVQEQLKSPVLRVVQGGSQPAISNAQTKMMMLDRIPLETRDRGKSAIAGLDRLLSEDFTKQEQGFKRSLAALKETLAGLLNGTVPEFKQYNHDAIEALVSRNHEIRIRLEIEDGKPVLCPEMEYAMGTLLYMMKESEISKKVGVRIGKEDGGERQIILISGAGMKNLGPDVAPAIRSAVEMLGCEYRPNGTSVTILVPLRPTALTS
jgi:hypothetical protein